MEEVNPLEKEKLFKLSELIHDLLEFGSTDLLVQLDENYLLPVSSTEELFHIDESSEALKIFKKNSDHFKETGTATLCLSLGVLTIEYKGQVVRSPLMLVPAEVKRDKIKRLYVVEVDFEAGFINPFLEKYFQSTFDIGLSELISPSDPYAVWDEKLLLTGVQMRLEPARFLGNFHHHRFAILRDLDALNQLGGNINTNIREIINGSFQGASPNLPMSPRLVLPSDDEQSTVLSDLPEKNLVVQGPPGTGKSQLLTNATARILFGGYKALVVSEKRVALEVIQTRLQTVGLSRFAFLPDATKSSHQLLTQLKDNWEWMEKFHPNVSHQLDLSSQLVDALQLKLNVLGKDDLIGGISFTEYFEKLKGRDLSQAIYDGNSASIIEWHEKKVILQKLYALNLNKLTRHIPQNLIHEDRIFSLENNIRSLEKRWNDLRQHFAFDSKAGLTDFMRKASFAQLMSNEIHQPYFRSLNPSKAEFNKFGKLYSRVLRNLKQLEQYQDQLKNWKIQPSKEEAIGILKTMELKGFLRKFKRKKKLKQLLFSPFVDAKTALIKWVNYCDLMEEKVQLEQKMLALGINDTRQMDWVYSMQLKVKKEDFEIWRAGNALENAQLASHNADLHIFYQNLRSFLHLEEDASLSGFFELFQQQFSRFVEQRNDLENLSDNLYKQVGQHENVEQLELSIFKSNWSKFIGQFSTFQKFKIENLHQIIEEIIDLQDKENTDFASKVHFRMHQHWEHYQKLLLIGTKKLKKEERLLKESLKAGKAILIKEFGKTRSHPTIRELMETDARLWLDVLLPIWMLNPSQVADFFPIQENSFDFLLVDEATQVPLANSLGAIQRAKRVMIVGDSEQMTPMNYFKSGDSEPLDLLHQASFTWKKHLLKHHYRSENPQLIAFSNKNFYANQLIAFPSPDMEEIAVKKHLVTNGVYDNRVNIKEAQALANKVKHLLQTDEKIGVVAFSESQLLCIQSCFSEKDKERIAEKVDKDLFFFKALENVQGDECDRLFISLGYGPNPEGKILLNFGPLNRKTGRRRLNVLFSRARKSIDLFTSLDHQDLVISQNEALNLLRQYLFACDQDYLEKNVFPYELQGITNGRRITFQNVFLKMKKATDLISFHRVMKNRGWQVDYQ